ncbi:MAG: AarF/UbiB family protein [Pseudobdellovibrionaceae bacterium]
MISKLRHAEDEASRQKAAQYLADIFANERGILLKIGQFMASHSEALEPLQPLASAQRETADHPAILALLEASWKKDPHLILDEISDHCMTASLSKVYACRLKGSQDSQEKWALKVQLPGVRKNIDSLLRVLGLIPNLGPSRKYGVNLNEYKVELQETLNRELDYGYEQKVLSSLQQEKNPRWIQIPKTVPELCTRTVMVLEYFEGVPLDAILQKDEPLRKMAAEKMVSLFLHQLSRWTYFQSDWNPGNLLFSFEERGLLLQIIDFGSFFKFSEAEKSAIHSLFSKMQQKEIKHGVEDLQNAGFDLEKIHLLGPKTALDTILTSMFAPFLRNEDFDLKLWDYAKDIDNLLGEMKWWFRSAGTPRLFHFVRAYALLMQNLKKLKVKINFHKILLEHEFKARSTAKPLPEIINIDNTPQWAAKFLKVRVTDFLGKELVFVTMPIHAINYLEDCLPDEALEKVADRGIRIEEIKQGFFERMGPVGILFEMKDKEKNYKVWSE